MANIEEKIVFLERVSREVPEYAEVLVLFRELYVLIDGPEGETGISFTPPGEGIGEMVRGGFPLITPAEMAVDTVKAASFLAAVVGVMARVGREGDEALGRLRDALAGGALDPAPLFAACLKRERGALEGCAAVLDIPAPLLEFVIEAALRTALERLADSLEPGLFEGWGEVYCPVCGSRPGMAELAGEEGKRFLSCSACSYNWPFTRIKCAYCGCEEPEKLSYFEAGEGPVRVDVCRTCSRYIKTRDSRKGHAGVPLDAEDLATIHLDLLASREGFERGK